MSTRGIDEQFCNEFGTGMTEARRCVETGDNTLRDWAHCISLHSGNGREEDKPHCRRSSVSGQAQQIIETDKLTLWTERRESQVEVNMPCSMHNKTDLFTGRLVYSFIYTQ